MAEEKQFTIPLRRGFLKKPKYKRTRKAVNLVREFIIKHMKVKQVKIGKHLNQLLWSRGMRSPPGKVKVKSIKEEDYARVELSEFEFEKKKEPEKKEGLKEKILGKKEPKKTDEQKEEELVKEGKLESKEEIKIEEKITQKKEDSDTLTETKKRYSSPQKPSKTKKK